MSRTNTADAVVVGAGVIGAAIALELAPRPAMVELFDRAGVPYEEWETGQLRTRLPYDTGRYWPPKPVDDAAFFAGELGAVGTVMG